MKEFELLTVEEKKELMTVFLSEGNSEDITFKEWYELGADCFNGK